MRKNKNRTKIILAGVVAVITMMACFGYLSRQKNEMAEKDQVIAMMQNNSAGGSEESYAYAIAADNLKAGEMVTDIDVDFKNFNNEQFGAFENRSDVVNKVLLKDISAGEVFTTNYIAKVSSDNIKLKDGYRALTLPADNFQGKSNKMVLGSSVDMYSAKPEDAWVFEDVKLIGFEGGKDAKISDINGASSVTFEVPVGEISDFITNASKGKIVLVARNANDKRIVHKIKHSKNSGSFAGSIPSLKNLPTAPPISNLSGLPQPIQPTSSGDAVEVIEANVKSKVTFE